MAISIVLNGTSTQDETAGLQNLASPDADNDVSIASLPIFFSNRLFTQLGLSATFATTVGVADSAADMINVDADGPLTSLGLTQANGDPFDGSQTTGLFTTEGEEIFLLSDSNNQIVLGVTAANEVVFAVYMETSVALDGSTNVELWTVTFEAIDHPSNASYDEPVDIFENVYVTATGSLTFNFDALPSGSNLFGVVGESPDDSAIIVIGKNPAFNADGNYTNASDVIHTSQGGGPTTIGVNNQMFDPGDGAYFTYVNDPVGNFLSGFPNGLSPTEADDADNIQYTGGTLDVGGAFLKISQIQGNAAATMRLTTYLMPDDFQARDFTNNLGDGDQIDITTVKVYNAAGTLIEDTSDLANFNSPTVAVTFSNGVATVSGLLANYRVEWVTDGDHNQVLVEGVTGKFDIGLFGITQGDFQSLSLANHVFVEDDGPTITATATGNEVRHDETSGVQADTDDPGSDIAFGASTIASLFTNVPSPGDDPHVTGTGAIGFARSTTSPVVVTGGSAGTDGPAAQELSYALSVVNGTFSGVSTTGGTQIFMYNGTGTAAGLILGRVGTEAGGTDTANSSGTVAFALAVNPATGEVFLAQYLSLLHGNTASHDETITLASGAVQLSVSRTDGDGDVATDSDNNIGLLVKFDDDGPTITAEVNNSASLVHDETTGVQADTDDPGSDNAFGATTIASLFTNVPNKGSDDDVAVKDNGAIGFARSTASLVTVTGGSFGADGPGTVSTNYALGVTDGTWSGVQTTEGVDIFLYNGTGTATGLILGRLGTEASATPGSDTPDALGTVAFALAINPATGDVFVAQYLTIFHNNTGSDDEASAVLINSAVQVTVTRTDGDGDSIASLPIDVGGRISFQDGGPEPVPAGNPVNPLLVDDTEIPDSSAVFADDLFTAPDFNEDGPGTIGYALDLSAENADSGLVDTLTGKSILFVTEAGTGDIVGYVDEDGLGTIGVGETLEALRYHFDDKGNSITSDDEVTLTQSRSVEHDDATDPDEADFPKQVALGTVFLDRTITDGDGDPEVDDFDLGSLSFLKDDGPSNFTPADIVGADAVQNQPGESAIKDLTGSNLTTVIADHSGKDGFGSLAFDGTNGSLLQGSIGGGGVVNLTSGNSPIYLFGFGTGTLVATTDNVTPTDQTDWVFTITLNSANDNYTFNMLGQIDNGAEALFLDFSGQKQTIYEWLTLDLPGDDPGDVDGPDANTTIDPAERDGDILFTGVVRTSLSGGFVANAPGTAGEINVSSTGIGIESQSINPLEGSFIDFIDGAPRTLDGHLHIADLDFDNHFTVNNAGFAISQLKPNTNTVTDVRVSVYNETSADPADSAAQIINDATLDITAITVRTADNLSSHTFTGDDLAGTTIGGRLIKVDFDPANGPGGGTNYVEIDNLGEGYQVLIETASGFERILVENAGSGNEGFDISGIIVSQFDAGDPITMNFDLTLLDGDLDLAGGSFDVTLTPPDQII